MKVKVKQKFRDKYTGDIRFTGDLNKTDDFKSILKIIEQNERVTFTVNQRTVFIQAK